MKYAYTAGLSMPMVESRLLLMTMFALPNENTIWKSMSMNEK